MTYRQNDNPETSGELAMAYGFTTLDANDLVEAKARVKYQLERDLYDAALKLQVDPATFDYAGFVVPETAESDPLYGYKLNLKTIWDQIQWLASF